MIFIIITWKYTYATSKTTFSTRDVHTHSVPIRLICVGTYIFLLFISVSAFEINIRADTIIFINIILQHVDVSRNQNMYVRTIAVNSISTISDLFPCVLCDPRCIGIVFNMMTSLSGLTRPVFPSHQWLI